MSQPTNSIMALPREVLLSLGLLFLTGLADGALTPIFPIWAKTQLGMPVSVIGSLFACYAGGELLATPIVGGIADRVGRRPVLIISSLGVGVGFALLFFVRNAPMAAICLLFVGCFESVLHPTISAVIADKAPDLKRRYSFALTRVMSNAGRIVGPAIGALIAVHALKGVFLLCASAMFVAAVIVALLLPETLAFDLINAAADARETPASPFKSVLSDRILLQMLLWLLCLQMSGSWLEAVLPLYANQTGSMTASGVSLLFTFGASLIVVFQLGVSRLLQKASGFQLVWLAGLSLFCGFSVLALSASVAAMIFAITTFAIAQMMLGPLVPTIVNELAPRHARATYTAAASVVSDLRDTAGPAIGTLLFSFSARIPWLAGIPIALAAASALASTVKRHESAADRKSG